MYYVQYAHARIASVLRKAGEERVAAAVAARRRRAAGALDPAERSLVKKLAAYPDEVAEAAAAARRTGSPTYALELAQEFTAFYRDCRVVGAEPAALEAFRLALSVGDAADDRLGARAARRERPGGHVRRAALLLVAVARSPRSPRPPGRTATRASDTIIGVDSFLPYTPPVSAAVARKLTATVKAARAKGKPVKVVVIGSAPDLGSVSSLFGQPQKYAEFLSREDAFAVKDPVLVVMGKGFGFAKVGAPLDLGFAKDVKIPGNATSDQLAMAATDAAGRYAGIKVAGLSGWARAAAGPRAT